MQNKVRKPVECRNTHEVSVPTFTPLLRADFCNDVKVKVLFFGQTAEIVGEREVEMSLDESTKASAAFAKIIEKYQKLKENKLLFAINQEYSNGNEIIKNGDELAVFTAVSGG